MTFDGSTYDEARDGKRLRTQLERVRDVLLDGKGHRLDKIMEQVGCSSAGVTARIRDLRKPKNGSHVVISWADEQIPGLWWYRLLVR